VLPSKCQLLSPHPLGEEGLLSLLPGGKLEVSHAAVLDPPDIHRGHGGNVPPQLDCSEAGVLLQLFFHHPADFHSDFPRPPRHQLPGHDRVAGVSLSEGQYPPQGPLTHLELFLILLRGTLAFQSLISPLVFVFEAFSCYARLQSAKEFFIYKQLPNRNGEKSSQTEI
jgi:hypothetical protein